MSITGHPSKELEKIYSNRFGEHIAYRNEVWKVLTNQFFSKLLPPSACVLDLGCGYGEFINNIRCGRKYGLDLNPAARTHLASGVQFFEQNCAERWPLPDESLDLVFTSNFFEHLPDKSTLSAVLNEAFRCLRPG